MNSRRWISRWTSAGSNQARRWGFRWVVLGLLWSVSAGPLQAQLTPGVSPQAQLEAQREQVVLAYYETLKESLPSGPVNQAAAGLPLSISVSDLTHYPVDSLNVVAAANLVSPQEGRILQFRYARELPPSDSPEAGVKLRYLQPYWSPHVQGETIESQEKADAFFQSWVNASTEGNDLSDIDGVTSFDLEVSYGLNSVKKRASFVWLQTVTPEEGFPFMVADPVLFQGMTAVAWEADPERRQELASELGWTDPPEAQEAVQQGAPRDYTWLLHDDERGYSHPLYGPTMSFNITAQRQVRLDVPGDQECMTGQKGLEFRDVVDPICIGEVMGLPPGPATAFFWFQEEVHTEPGFAEITPAEAGIACVHVLCPKFPCGLLSFKWTAGPVNVNFSWDTLTGWNVIKAVSDSIVTLPEVCPGGRQGDIVKVKVQGIHPDSGHTARITANVEYEDNLVISHAEWFPHLENPILVSDRVPVGGEWTVIASEFDENGTRLGLCEGGGSGTYLGLEDIPVTYFTCNVQSDPLPFLPFPRDQRCPAVPELCGIEPSDVLHCYFHGSVSTNVQVWASPFPCYGPGGCGTAPDSAGGRLFQGEIWCVPANAQGSSEAATLYEEGPLVYLRVLFPEAGIHGVVQIEGVARDDQWGITRILPSVDGAQPLDLISGVEHGLPDQYTCDEFPSANCDANSGFRFAFDADQLSPGEHVLEVLALNERPDASMPTRLTIPFTVRGDSCDSPAMPVTYLTTPEDGAVVAGTTVLAASATDDTGVSAVDFYVDGVFRHQDTTPPYEWAWDTTAETDGTHEVRSLAIDTCGNRKFGPQHYVTVANHPQEISLLPVADAFVSQTNPTGNFGAATILRVRTAAGGYGRHGYLLFDLPEITGRVVGVKLRLRGGDYPIPDFTVWHVRDTAWTESTLNWTNASMNAVELAGGVYVPVQAWIDVDLPGAVDLMDSGLLSLALSTGVDFQSRDVYSRESAFPPELVIEVVE